MEREIYIDVSQVCWRCDKKGFALDEKGRPLCSRHALIFVTAPRILDQRLAVADLDQGGIGPDADEQEFLDGSREPGPSTPRSKPKVEIPAHLSSVGTRDWNTEVRMARDAGFGLSGGTSWSEAKHGVPGDSDADDGGARSYRDAKRPLPSQHSDGR